MDFLYLFVSTIGESATYTIDKLNYKRNKLGFRQFMFLSFLIMSLCLLAFIVLTRQPFPQFVPASLILVALVIAFSFSGNAFDAMSLKADDLSLREPLVDFQPILAGLIGYLLFPAERKTAYLIAFLMGILVVYWGCHRRKLRKFERKGLKFLLIAGILYAVLPSLYQQTLHYISPTYLAFFRTAGIFILSALFLPVKNFKGFTRKKIGYAIVSNVIASVAAIAGLYAIQVYGVVLTMLFFMLGPALRYLAGYFLLHEKVRRGEVISSLILATIVAFAAFVH